MKGIQFVVDESGNKKAVIIDLSEWGEAWENIYDVLIGLLGRMSPRLIGKY